MKYIQLTQGMRTKVDDDLYEWLNQWKWYYRKRWNRPGGDAVRTLHGVNKNGLAFSQTLYMSNLICPVPRGYVVDHKDQDPMNNQRLNLRKATYSMNNMNSGVRVNNKIQEKNIHWDHAKQRFIVQIRVGDSRRLWKAFRTLLEAKEYRDITLTQERQNDTNQ